MDGKLGELPVRRFIILVLSVLLLAQPTFAFAAKYVATIILIRGKVAKKIPGAKKHERVQLKDRLPEGTIISTSKRSFVKLLFADKTQINLGPESQMKIERFKSNEPGMIKLISGKIRAKVTKDFLSSKVQKRSNKLLIRTKTAAMGVRGTDFQVVYSEANESTSLISFENEVAMAPMDPNENLDAFDPKEVESRMEAALNSDNAVTVSEGRYSSASPKSESALPPIRIAPTQLEALRNNETFVTAAATATPAEQQYISPIPPGVDPKDFASQAAVIEQVMEAAIGAAAMDAIVEAVTEAIQNDIPEAGSEQPERPEDAPLEGGYVDLATNTYIEPNIETGAIYDPVLDIYLPDPTVTISDEGGILLPEGVELTADGEIIITDPSLFDGGVAPIPGEQPGDRLPAGDVPPPTDGESFEDSLLDEEETEEEESSEIEETLDTPTSTEVTFQITTS